ncbi:hypothetical protein [Mesoplasma seiffertii]
MGKNNKPTWNYTLISHIFSPFVIILIIYQT